MSDSLFSMERIDYQLNSTLAQKIGTLCQSALLFVNSSKTADQPSSAVRTLQIKRWLDREFKFELGHIILEELNLPSHIDIETRDAHFFNVWMIPKFHFLWNAGLRPLENADETVNTESVFAGTAAHELQKYKDRSLYEALAKYTDPVVGKLKKVPDNYSIYLSIPTNLFNADELVSGIEGFTAAEITAVILHELGHAITILEFCADQYYRATVIEDALKYMRDTPTGPRAGKITKQAIDALSAITVHGQDKTMQAALLAKVKSIPHENMGVGSNHGYVYTLVSTIMMFITNRLYSAEEVFVNAGHLKTSDLHVTKMNRSYIERIADEFVSRHGLGLAMATALKKLNDWHDFGHDKGTIGDAMRTIPIVSGVAAVMRTVGSLLCGPCINYSYDSPIERLRQLYENNLSLFKDKSLSKELTEQYLGETQQILKTIKDFEAAFPRKVKDFIWGTMLRLTTKGSIIDTFYSANLSADYDRLQRLTNGLIRNPLYMQSAKIGTLIS